MKTLFSTWNQEGDAAQSTIPEDHAADLTGSQFQVGDRLLVRPFWSHVYWSEGKRKAVLLTYGVPFDPGWKPIVQGDEPFSCHACTPLLGIAVFIWTGGEWKAAWSHQAVSRVGAWGRPPSPVQLMKIGPETVAARITNDDEGGGVTIQNIQIIPLEGSISTTLVLTLGEDNIGGCEKHQPSDEPACYHYRRTVTLKAGPNPHYYDIWTELRGTDYDEGQSRGTHRVSGKELYRVVNGAYQKILPLP